MTQEKTEKEPPEDRLSDYIGKLYHLTRNVNCRSGDVPEIHQVRDAGAFNDARGPLEQQGYEWESELMLYAYKGKEEADVSDQEQEPTEMLALQAEDCVAMTTRLPMSDAESEDRVQMELAGDEIEGAAIEALRPFVEFCSRSTIEFNSEFISGFQRQCKAKKGETPTEFRFAQHSDARIQSFRTMDGKLHKQSNENYSTLGFFLNLPSMPKFGCRFVNAWAQGGKENAAWCRILRKRFAHWFERPRFSVVWLTFNQVPDCPTTLHYADAASAEVIIDYTIEDPGEGQAPASKKRCA